MAETYDNTTLIQRILSCVCCFIVSMKLFSFPFKPPPILMGILLSCVSWCFCSYLITMDTKKRFAKKEEPEEE
jgi:Gpi18-like mannosyltransferase